MDTAPEPVEAIVENLPADIAAWSGSDGGDNAPIDLKAFFRYLGRVGVSSGAESAVEEREEPIEPAELIDTHPLNIRDVSPLKVDGFVDGIQATMAVAYREHRGVFLQHVAAGCLDDKARILRVSESLTVVCAAEEKEWVEASGAGIPVEVVEATDPSGVWRRAHEIVASKREAEERAVAAAMLAGGCGFLVVDGSIMARNSDRRLIGVVKSHRRRYLADETILYGLAPGWRSPRFKLEEGSHTRYSAYLRMFDASQYAWDFGLVRIETNDADLIDAACAMALRYRGAPGGDSRWDRHLAPVINVEKVLRARRPSVFSI